MGEGELTKDLKKCQEHLDILRDKYADGKLFCEMKWGFDENWEPCDFFDDNVWTRQVPDAIELYDNDKEITLWDYKTGKHFGNEVKHMRQGQIYMVGAFMKYPQLETVEVKFLYLDHNKIRRTLYTRSKLPRYLKTVTEQGKALTDARTFPPKPSKMNCKYCDFGPQGTDVCPESWQE